MHGTSRPLRIYAFTSSVGLVDVLPPVRLQDALPKWWAELDAFASIKDIHDKQAKGLKTERIPTAKHCYSMQEIFKNGIGIPLWADTHVILGADGGIDAEGSNRNVRPGGTHHPIQFKGMVCNGAQHFKFVSPWSFVCERAVHFIWTHPFYHQSDPFRFHTMPGIVEYRNQHSTNVNVIIPSKAGIRRELDFNAGEMLVYVFPMCERPVKLIVAEVTERDHQRINSAAGITSRPLVFNRRRNLHPWIPSHLLGLRKWIQRTNRW